MKSRSAMNSCDVPARLVRNLPSLLTTRFLLTVFSALLLAMSLGCGTAGNPSGNSLIQDPSIASFTATPATITGGQSSTLSWSVNGASSVSISNGSGNITGSNSVPTSFNSVAVTPTATTDYTLTAANQNGKTITSTITVTVVDKPVILSFAASPPVISDRQNTTLSWSVTGATSLTINNGVGDVTGRTSVTVSPATTTTYQLVATNGTGGSSSVTVVALTTVTVVPTPVITNFTANPSTISSGQSSTLSFSVSGVTGVSIDNGIGSVSGTSVNVSPTATTTYTLTASNTVGSFTATSTAQTVVTVSATAVPVINSFTVDHPSVGPNGTVKLTANFDLGQGGGTATITTNNGATVIARGSSSPMTATLPVASSTTFTLTATNVDGNSVTANVRVLAGIISVFAGVPSSPGNQDGTGASAGFNLPHGLAMDTAGNLFVADISIADNTFSIIRRATVPGAVVTTLIDNSTGLPAQFKGATNVAVDSSGKVYVADTNNHTIDEITPAGDATILAGTPGVPGSNDSNNPPAQFNGPQGIAVDAAGNLFVSDTNNNTIRMITPAGVVSTLAGVAGAPGAGDSPAHFNFPTGIAIDTAGNLYISDAGNNTIRKITTPAGVVSTLAGSAGQRGSADGTGGAARFSNPSALAIDPSGNVYVADVNNDTIRRITSEGVVVTILGVAGSGKLRLGPLPGGLGAVHGVAVDPSPGGNLYLTVQNAILSAPY